MQWLGASRSRLGQHFVPPAAAGPQGDQGERMRGHVQRAWGSNSWGPPSPPASWPLTEARADGCPPSVPALALSAAGADGVYNWEAADRGGRAVAARRSEGVHCSVRPAPQKSSNRRRRPSETMRPVNGPDPETVARPAARTCHVRTHPRDGRRRACARPPAAQFRRPLHSPAHARRARFRLPSRIPPTFKGSAVHYLYQVTARGTVAGERRTAGAISSRTVTSLGC
jgi:hypothetical protein